MMPKKLNPESQKVQSARFKRELQKLIDAGELSPTEADARMERAMHGVARLRDDWFTEAEGPGNPEPTPS